MKHNSYLLLVVVLMGVMGALWAQPAVRIDSGGVADTRISIAVPPFVAMDPQFQRAADEMAQAIADDLAFSGLFILLPPTQYPVGFTGMDPDVRNINLTAWRATKAENLVYGIVYAEGSQLVGQFRLFDLYANTQLYGQEVRVERDHYRLASHRFSEEIIRNVDAVPGIGTTELFFSAVSGTNVKEIYVADYDGANARKLTSHNSLSIMPEVSPDGNSIAYLSYKDRYGFLYIFDRASGASRALSKEVGLNTAASWTPDGKKLAMTLSKDGNAEIYVRNMDGGGMVRITNNKEGDTSPCYSPDGQRIAFISDRGGRPQVYGMNADGSNEVRLSYHGGGAYDPVWSPDGKSIAFVSVKPGEGYEVYIMGADGSNPVRITDSSGINEAPTWSPDSRHLAYASTRGGRPEIYTMTLSTREERKISRLNMSAEGPSWGPRRR